MPPLVDGEAAALQRALVIANPIAGRAQAPRCLEPLQQRLDELGIAVTTVLTEGQGHAREQTTARAAEHDVVVVVGGDGTLNEALNGLDVDRPIAVFPHGTGNVLAKELRLPRRIRPFCEMVAAGEGKRLDLAAVDGRRFVSMTGIGFDAAVAHRLATSRGGGIRMSRYALPILRTVAAYAFPRLNVVIDGREPVVAEGFVLVSNVRAYGGPFVIARQAVHDDGLLDVCLLPRGSRLRLLRAMVACMVGGQRSLSSLRYDRGKTVRITADEPVHFQADGDPMGTVPVTVRMLDRTQPFIVPPGAPA